MDVVNLVLTVVAFLFLTGFLWFLYAVAKLLDEETMRYDNCEKLYIRKRKGNLFSNWRNRTKGKRY